MGNLLNMSDKSFMLIARKTINNPLLARRQVVCDLIHPDSGSVSKESIKKKLGDLYKCNTDCIAIFGCKTKFGGGRSSCFALVYKSKDLRDRFDSKVNKERDMKEKPKTTGRKQKKEMKGRANKVRGTAKAKARASGGKKKK